MFFQTVTDATSIWIKGREFSVARMLGEHYGSRASEYEGGSLAIFRLAPQDYHRYHSPIAGVMGKQEYISGQYYTGSSRPFDTVQTLTFLLILSVNPMGPLSSLVSLSLTSLISSPLSSYPLCDLGLHGERPPRRQHQLSRLRRCHERVRPAYFFLSSLPLLPPSLPFLSFFPLPSSHTLHRI